MVICTCNSSFRHKFFIILSVFFLLLFNHSYSQVNDSIVKSDTSKGKIKKPKVKVSGYVQVHYLDPVNSNGDTVVEADRFRVLRARIEFKGDITKKISFDVMIDPRSPMITGFLRDAFISLKFIPNQELRIGQQKTQFGYENPESSRNLYVVNRSEVSDNLSRGVNLRDIGVGLIGKWKLGKGFRFEDAITFVNGAGMNVAGPEDFNRKKNLWGRAGLRYKKEEFIARLGISGGIGDILDQGDPLTPDDDFLVDFKRIGADAEIEQKWFFMAAEYVLGPDDSSGIVSDRSGYYILVAGKTPWRAGPLIRYDVLDDDVKRITAGAWYGLPADPVRVLLNYEYRGFRNEEFPNGDDDRLYIQLQVRF